LTPLKEDDVGAGGGTLANYYDDPAEFDRLTQQATKVTLARSAKQSRQVDLH